MLQDPVKGVLVPLAPEELVTVSDVPVALDPVASHGEAGWNGLADVALVQGSARLDLHAALACLPALPAPGQTRYDDCFSAMIGGEYSRAGAGFAALALSGVHTAPALYGVALALEKLGAYAEAEELATFVSELPGYNDPRAAALAGYTAFQRRQSKTARVHLARAARLARLHPEFRNVQRFAQRVLLMQQFALGD
jgi:hypothetical protein